MLYMMQSSGALLWNDFPESILKSLRDEGHDFEMAQLEWEPAEQPATAMTVRLALRHGFVCTGGIVFSPYLVSAERRPGDLRRSTDEALESSAKLRAANPHMDAVIPGFHENWKKTDAGIAATTEESIAEAQRELDKLLAADPVPELVQHWRSIRGFHSDQI